MAPVGQTSSVQGRWIGLLVCVVVALGCSDDGSSRERSGSESGRDVVPGYSETAELETWEETDESLDAQAIEVTFSDGGDSCTMVTVGADSLAAVWPPGATRVPGGIRVGDDVIRFDEPVTVRGRDYSGPSTTTECVATGLWLVIGLG